MATDLSAYAAILHRLLKDRQTRAQKQIEAAEAVSRWLAGDEAAGGWEMDLVRGQDGAPVTPLRTVFRKVAKDTEHYEQGETEDADS